MVPNTLVDVSSCKNDRLFEAGQIDPSWAKKDLNINFDQQASTMQKTR
jgi:hypothetical protein